MNTASALELRRRLEPGSTDEALVRALCEDLLDEAGVAPPVNVQLLASLQGIGTIEPADIPAAGMISTEDGGLVVRVRATDPLERQRFTILHELGHTFLPGFEQATRYRCEVDGPGSAVDDLADLVASELLLPRRHFIRDSSRTGFGLDSVEELALMYGASIEATALRYVDVGAEHAMLQVYEMAYKPSELRRAAGSVEPRLRLRYSRGPEPRPYLPRHKSVAPESLVQRAYDGETIHENADISDCVPLASGRWPVELCAKRYGGRVLVLTRPC